MKRPGAVNVLVVILFFIASCRGTPGPAGTGRHAAGERCLQGAMGAARWLLARGCRDTGRGLAWFAEPGDPSTVSMDLYHGSAGVILFLLEAHHVTGRKEFLEAAERSADDLVQALSGEGPATGGPSLYTGEAGIAFALLETFKACGDPVYREAALGCARRIASAVKRKGAGVEWNECTDIIRGSAGIGLFLLYAAKELDYRPALEAAVGAGEALLQSAVPDGNGLKWPMDPDYPRLMPNFSHGTAGVCYFLAALYRGTGKRAFLEAALGGGRRLLRIANGEGLVFHHEPGGEDLFYLGWCHGPAGTARLYWLLWEITRDETWLEAVERAAGGVMRSGIPERRTPGFWNNAGQCCGAAGVAEFFLDLHRSTGRKDYLDFARRMVENVLAGASQEAGGLKWIQAEYRVKPGLLAAQTGYMQGAAGIGMLFLHMYEYEKGMRRAIALPDSPFSSRRGSGR